MPDMLVKLYNLDHDWSFIQQQKKLGVTIRKPIGAVVIPDSEPSIWKDMLQRGEF